MKGYLYGEGEGETGVARSSKCEGEGEQEKVHTKGGERKTHGSRSESKNPMAGGGQRCL